ncbi:FKBP12-associated protein [Gnomoniopsis smithogilvyi]|uniref:FKBP12-associated protein n=1 Tax=Gnomoniopsis smithogilvyi TaxID=1191159 RepID=A0A9W8YZY7_9PEZI|nr:FKBP12-associated protein [Gnomoniopsis smithogilvyi]
MAEVQTGTAHAAPSTSQTAPASTSRRGRSGRGRGRGNNNRGSGHGRGGRAAAPNGEVNPPTQDATISSAEGGAATPAESQGLGSRGGRGRRGGPRRGRGGRLGQETHVAPPRTFGGRLTSTIEDDSQSLPGLSVNAPEFVPGQPLQQRARRPPKTKEAPQPRQRRASKSEAPDLTTRIHEDIDNGQYECVICSSEVVRTSRIWACSLCWTVTHFHCTKKWYTSQLKEGQQPQGAEPTWRCAGCNSKLTEDPGSYHCWCGKELNPRSIPGVPPHSCGQTCFKPRGTCPHPCGLQCHSGPCPPCTLMGPVQSCYCGKNSSQKRCVDTDYTNGFSCNEVCADLLPCGDHTCPQKCHPGICGACEVLVPSTCYCGKEHKEIPCDQRDDVLESYNHGQLRDGSELSTETWFEVPTTCHGVPQDEVVKPECPRTCRALLNCGRHQCDSRCCPGEKRAAKRQAVKRRIGGPANEDVEDEHLCTRTCNRLLKCGKHFCEALCHKGPCPSCLEAIYDEISCSCGRTTLYPPQPCGTQPPQCRFPCTRGRACGHPQVEHQCHPDDVECPKCPFLVEKTCICGKEVLRNQPCWFAEARCGRPCGKKLKCGTHFCNLLCHRGDCEDAGIPGSHCSQPCGQARESCGHEDLDQCHAPFACKEERPCQSETFHTCDCQRRKQKVKCLSTRLEPRGPHREPLKCDDECLRQKRNRQLAEALNVDPDHTDDHIPYQDLTLKLFRDNTQWAQTQEREFRVFADSNGRNMRFKPMKAYQRQFLHALAEDFGMDSESQDPEPHRHVSIFKGPRFVSAPRKTLMQCLRILKANAPSKAAAATPATMANKPTQQPYNALLLSRPRFGLTIEEVDSAVASDLKELVSSNPILSFATSFLPTDEVLIKANTKATVASIASGTLTPAQIDNMLTALKPKVAKAVAGHGLAAGVTLCTADPSSNIVRREGTGEGSNGWSTVASRAAARPRTWAPAPVVEPKQTGFMTLRRLGAKKPVPPQPEIQEAAKKEENVTPQEKPVQEQERLDGDES